MYKAPAIAAAAAEIAAVEAVSLVCKIGLEYTIQTHQFPATVLCQSLSFCRGVDETASKRVAVNLSCKSSGWNVVAMAPEIPEQKWKGCGLGPELRTVPAAHLHTQDSSLFPLLTQSMMLA